MHLVYILQHDSESSSLIIGLLSHRSSPDFCWGGGHPTDATHPCISRAHVWNCCGQLAIWALQQSAESWLGGAPERNKNSKTYNRWNDIWGRFFCKCCQPQIHKCMWNVLPPTTVFTVYLYVLRYCAWNKMMSYNLIFCIVYSQCARLLMNNGTLITFDILYTFRNNELQTLFCSALAT